MSNRTDKFEKIWQEAYEAGLRAGHGCTPTPMIVGSPSTPLGNDIDPNKPTYFVEDGVCGFASVVAKPATSSFCKWWKRREEQKTGREVQRNYYGGYTVYWVSEFNQSYQRKCAFAHAFAAVLQKHGIKCRVEERLD